MQGRHRITRPVAAVAAVVAVGGLAVLIGYVMGNYAITAVTTTRHRTTPPARTVAPVKPPAAPAPADPRLLTELGADSRPATGTARPGGEAAKPASAAPLHRVQVGPFTSRQEAVAGAGQLLSEGYPAYVVSDRPYRVQVGAFTRREAAQRLVAELQAKGHPEAHLVEP